MLPDVLRGVVLPGLEDGVISVRGAGIFGRSEDVFSILAGAFGVLAEDSLIEGIKALQFALPISIYWTIPITLLVTK